MRQLLRETWDLLGEAVLACWLLGIVLYLAGVVPSLMAVLVGGAAAGVVLVFCALWILVLAGGSVPW